MTYRFLWLVVAALLAFNAAAQLATKKGHGANGVTVAVTPANLAARAKTWDFSIPDATVPVPPASAKAIEAGVALAKEMGARVTGYHGVGAAPTVTTASPCSLTSAPTTSLPCRPSRRSAMTELNVKGMTCGHCVTAVTRAVKSVDPSAAVQVDLQSGRVRVEGRTAAGELIKALEEAGYPASPTQGEVSPTPRKGCCCAR